MTIPAELGKKVLPAGCVGETAVTVRLYLTGHRLVQKKGQCAGIIPQPAVFDEVPAAGIAEQLHPHGGSHTLQLNTTCIADGISADSTADVVGQFTG